MRKFSDLKQNKNQNKTKQKNFRLFPWGWAAEVVE